MTELDRRTLLSLLGGLAATGLAGCEGSVEAPRDGLTRLLGLGADEADWLDVLDEVEQADLYAALTSANSATSRAVGLLAKVLTPRSRLLAYVGYGKTSNRRTACDGLFRE
jgi:hypothetical protein